jgi:hypothetical protein
MRQGSLYLTIGLAENGSLIRTSCLPLRQALNIFHNRSFPAKKSLSDFRCLEAATRAAGKTAAEIAAVEIALDHILDDGPEEAVRLLEPALILGQEPVEVMKQDP